MFHCGFLYINLLMTGSNFEISIIITLVVVTSQLYLYFSNTPNHDSNLGSGEGQLALHSVAGPSNTNCLDNLICIN